MPELPEVETIVRRYRPDLEGRRIVGFASYCPQQVRPGVASFRRAIVGQTITRLTRRAKYILAHLDRGGLLLHLGMSGRLEWSDAVGFDGRHVRAAWELDNGRRLVFCDPRKFGRIRYVRDLKDFGTALGPEPLESDFSVTVLGRLLGRHRRQLKPLLLDQSVIAGLGNIYADEVLFRARLHPTTRSDQLTGREVRRLHQAIRQVLRQAIAYQGTSFDWAYAGGRMQTRLQVYGRAGRPCPRCRTPIARIRVAQRSTHLCPQCQPADGRAPAS